MTATAQTPPYTLGPDEKVAQVMAYTANALFWGEVVVKEVIRVSTWLRTNSAPDQICLYNAHAVLTSSGAQAKPMPFTELHVPVRQINLFHMIPPAKDPPDYDPTEPNRRMQPVSVLVGNFRVDAHLRLATQSSLAKFLDVSRDLFTSLYDAQITSPVLAAFRPISVPFVLVRNENSVFTLER